jgi:predicted enzyme related to lactoylglutathione lyase
VPTRDEAWPNGTPCWIDLMVTDPEGARQFYSALFGWDIQDGPPEAGGYLMCMLDGRPVSAISPKPKENPFPNVWSTYLASDDVAKTAAMAQEAGSQLMMEPMDVMSAGRMAFMMDPAGAPFGIWQAGDHKGVGIYNEPGALVWNELMSRDYDAAKAFYGTVFGYTYDEMDADFKYSTVKRAGDAEVVGGMGELDAKTPAEVPPSWVVYFLVADCDASVAKAAQLGASIDRQPFDTPFGRMAALTGLQGETFSLVQAPQQDQSGDGSSQG